MNDTIGMTTAVILMILALGFSITLSIKDARRAKWNRRSLTALENLHDNLEEGMTVEDVKALVDQTNNKIHKSSATGEPILKVQSITPNTMRIESGYDAAPWEFPMMERKHVDCLYKNGILVSKILALD